MIRLERKNYNMISTLSSWKIVEYEYITDEEIVSSNQNRIIEQAKFIYSSLWKAFEKQTKIMKIKEKNKWKQMKNPMHLLKNMIISVKMIVQILWFK